LAGGSFRKHRFVLADRPPELRSKAFRHTYARLQSLDRGAPVSIYTVARELGHGSSEMVERIYAHLGDVRHRALGTLLRTARSRTRKTPTARKCHRGRSLQRAGDRTRTGDVQLGKLAFYH
jgi:hypothetical protein